jgi:hypothetical protein
MGNAVFLSNEGLWHALRSHIRGARRTHAAIAYFGQGAAELIPLRKGDRLVVDMSLPTVKAGATDPREVEKLINRGALVFSRPNLHAKVVVTDRTVFAGSANASRRSHQLLDEAAIACADPAVLRRAMDFIDRLCTEPVRREYLAQCKTAYRPPIIIRPARHRHPGARRVSHAKLWLVGLVQASIPDAEIANFENSERKAARLLKHALPTKLDTFHWPHKPAMAQELESGDWIIEIVKQDDGTVLVYPPAQFLLLDTYVRRPATGARRHVFHLEAPARGQTMSWSEFRRKIGPALGLSRDSHPRTRPIRDVVIADMALRLWTPSGRRLRKKPSSKLIQ